MNVRLRQENAMMMNMMMCLMGNVMLGCAFS